MTNMTMIMKIFMLNTCMKMDVDIAIKITENSNHLHDDSDDDLQAHQHPAHPRQPYAQAVAPVTEK